MSKDSLEIQKELEKANTLETSEQFEKAAKSYFKAANLAVEDEQSLRLFNKAFFTARKSGQNDLMFEMGRALHEILSEFGAEKQIQDLVPTFLSVGGRRKDELMEGEISEDVVEVFEWLIHLYTLTENVEAAYDISQEAGEVISSVGHKILSGSYLIGKEGHWKKGLQLLEDGINAYQIIRLDENALQNILLVKMGRIGRLIDIGRYQESMVESAALLEFYDEQEQVLQPFSKKELTSKIAELVAEKCYSLVEAKRFDIAKDLTTHATKLFEEAEDNLQIGPFLWNLAIIYENVNQKQSFLDLAAKAVETAEKNNDQEITQTTIQHLISNGTEICYNILNSRRLLIQKGPVEFHNSEGVSYLLKAIDFSKRFQINGAVFEILDFLFSYASEMQTKKLYVRSLPYFEFAAQNLYTLDHQQKTDEILSYLENKYQEFITTGKFDDSTAHLRTVVSIKTFCDNAEDAGDTAFSFVQTIPENKKEKVELEFLELAYNAFIKIGSNLKLQQLLTYITHESDPLYNPDKKIESRRSYLLALGSRIAAGISIQTHGEFLHATTIKALNSAGLDPIPIAEEAFNILKTYDQKTAADLLFRVGSQLLDTRRETATEFIARSTNFAAGFEALKETVERNLTFLRERTLATEDLQAKLFFFDNFEQVTRSIGENESFTAFLLGFTQNLAADVADPETFPVFKKYLSKTFHEFFNLDPEHPKLEEIIKWTNKHILEAYPDEMASSMLEIAFESLAFHEKLSKASEFLDLFWLVFDKLKSSDKFPYAINLYKKTDQFLIRLEKPVEMRNQVTERVVDELSSEIKPLIHDEKFNEAWEILQEIMTGLSDANLNAKGIAIYQENAPLFAPQRLDIALTMWSQAIHSASQISDTQTLESIAQVILKETVPIYEERAITGAVNQLYSTVVEIYTILRKNDELAELYLNLSRNYLAGNEFDRLQETGQKGFLLATEQQNENILFEFANLYFAVGKGSLSEDPELGIHLIESASEALRNFGKPGFDYYFTKLAEIYEDLYTCPQTKHLAQTEREKILQHFRKTGKKQEEGKFLLTTAKLGIDAGNIPEGLDLIMKASDIFEEIEDNEGFGEIISICLKASSKHPIGSTEYTSLSNLASSIQKRRGVEMTEDQASEAYGDLFDGLLDDMTDFMDPKKRKKQKR